MGSSEKPTNVAADILARRAQPAIDEVFGGTSRVISDGPDRAGINGSNNPGMLTFIVYWIGVGLGFLLRSRSQRLRPLQYARPSANGRSAIATRFFAEA